MQTTTSIWMETTAGRAYPVLAHDVRVDVAVIGAGITGTTCALRLKAAGKRVALVDAQRVASGVSGFTTGHLSQAVDGMYYSLESKFGREGTRLVALSTGKAIEHIAANVEQAGIDCGFERLPGYLYAERDEEVEELDRELQACRNAGLEVTRGVAPLPFATKAALIFANQAQFHPRQYLLPLIERIPGDGSHVFEGTRIIAVDDGEPCSLHTAHGPTITADRVVLATHSPINGVLLETRIAHYQSYVLSYEVRRAPFGLFWDMQDPYHYVRAHRFGDGFVLIVGGEDHKTGQEPDTAAALERLAGYASRFEVGQLGARWSAQVVEPVDGLPFIGPNVSSERVFVATGFSGDGLTFGTLSGMILGDLCLNQPNPFAELYAATRVKPLTALGTFLAENVDFPLHLLSDRLKPLGSPELETLEPGEGRIIRQEGKRLAVARDDKGELHAVSAICTHLGCQVKFNTAERSWDCPCHGSRFDLEGKVLDGPATRPLEKQRLLQRD